MGEKTQTNNETPKTQKNSANTLNLKINSKENSQISQDKGVENSNNAINTHPQTPSAREGALSLDNATSQDEGALSLDNATSQDEGALSLDNATSQDEKASFVENFTPKFREFIDSKYKWSEADFNANPMLFVNSKICDEKSGLCSHERGNKTEESMIASPHSQILRIDEASGKLPDLSHKAEFTLCPEAILGYIYAVLYHKNYREKFLDFLKIDYPKIPFVASKESFLALSELGGELVNLHLMKADLNDEGLNDVGVAIDNGDDKVISKIAYNADSKEIFVNESLHFKGVERAVWEYKIGGYQVLDKYLKSHKATDKAKTSDKEKLDYAHFERIIKTLHKSLEIEKQIAKIELV